nr:natriuretic peptides A-like [Nerophis lumbriciformis]
MRLLVLWGLLPLLAYSHPLGRTSTDDDLAQIKSLLERFEETMSQLAQEQDSEPDYGAANREALWDVEQQDRDRDPVTPDRASPLSEAQSRAMSQRSRLMDLLLSARKRTSGCFGARMDRIGNASGLGCNNAKGQH